MGEKFTIQISKQLVDQLSKEDPQLRKRTRKPKPKIQPKPQEPQPQVLPPPPVPYPSMFSRLPPSPAQVANAELDAIRSVIKESEKVVERLQKQEDKMAQEVTQRAKELHEKEFKLPYQKPMPCVAEKDACLDCYKEHAKDPLKCANAVKSFADCARNIRRQMNSE
ncbi:hypothetical protein ACHQM5_001260 [Ranunculus cassubicifolius]